MKNILTLIFLSLCPLSLAQIEEKVILSPNSFKGEKRVIEFVGGWRYHVGDNPAWADPTFDDRDWETADTVINSNTPLGNGWEGIGWFRLHLTVDASLWNKPMALHLYQKGVSELYLDGIRIDRVGQAGSQATDAYLVRKILFSDKVDHLIAVRYSNQSAEALNASGGGIGFRIRLFEDANHTLQPELDRVKRAAKEQMFFTGVPLAFAILHMFLFAFYPTARQNLYYAVFTGLFAAMIFLDYHKQSSNDFEMVHHLVVILTLVSGLRFAYWLYYTELPKPFFLFLVAAMIVSILTAYNHSLLHLFSLVVLAEIIRIILVGILKKKEGAWIVGVGTLILVTVGFYENLMDLDILKPLGGINNPTNYAGLCLLVSMSVYLARNFARTNKDLETRSDELQQLNVELESRVDKRTAELAASNQSLEMKNVQLAESNDRIKAAHVELQKTQTQLVQSEKMAGLGHLAAGIAHEINNPIGAVNSVTDVSSRCVSKIINVLETGETLDEIKTNKQFQRALMLLEKNQQTTLKASDRIGEIVGSLKNFTRLDEAELQFADIHEGILSALTLLENRLVNRITVHKEFADLPKVRCYPGELNQVFMHLLTNAADAIEGKGNVWIKTWRQKDFVQFSVCDNGKGISEHALQQIFDPFFTTKPVGSGTGLGLAVSYQIIDRHGGKIEAESEVGKGTTFTIGLPINSPK